VQWVKDRLCNDVGVPLVHQTPADLLQCASRQGRADKRQNFARREDSLLKPVASSVRFP